VSYLRSELPVTSLDAEGLLLLYSSLIDTHDPGDGDLILETVPSSSLFSWILILEAVPLLKREIDGKPLSRNTKFKNCKIKKLD